MPTVEYKKVEQGRSADQIKSH